MANEPLTLAAEPEAPSDEEYQALYATLSATARGRAFLAEHGRRRRAADTARLLAAIERLEALVRSQMPPPAEPAVPTQMPAPATSSLSHSASIPDVSWFDGVPNEQDAPEPPSAQSPAVPPAIGAAAAREVFSRPPPRATSSTGDALAPILALSAEERLALFT